jgi:hypothetical protein
VTVCLRRSSAQVILSCASVLVQVGHAAVRTSLSVGSTMMIPALRAVTLDASSSFDPDIDPSVSNPRANLSYHWECYLLNGSMVEPCSGAVLDLSNLQKPIFTSQALHSDLASQFSYLLTVSASTSGGSTPSPPQSLTIDVLPADAPLVTVMSPAERTNPSTYRIRFHHCWRDGDVVTG